VLAGCGGSNKNNPQIDWADPAPITYGTELSTTQLNATASVPGSFAYSPSLGAVLPAGSQTLSVVFTPTDTTDYATVTTSVTLVVDQAPTSVSWTAPAAITYGTPLSATQLNATASVPGSFTYSPSLGAVLSAGFQTLSVTFTPTDPNYATSTASVTLTVNQVVPVVSWTAPAPIPYGTALSATQLNATASVPGAFAYNPSLGAALSTGSHTLSVTFTPADATDYTTATAGVALTVSQATPQITWAPTALIAVGAPLGPGQLDATATAPGGTTELAGSFLYSPAAGTIFSSPGPQTLSVTFTPADTVDYTTAQASLNMTASSFGVVAWGDSLTSGEEGLLDKGAYPEELQPLLVLTVENEGVGGNTSTQIGVRESGVPTYATVSGGVIPATGGVTVTFPKGYEPVTHVGPPAGVSGTILGVHGLVTFDSTDTIYTFTRTTPGNPVSAPGSPQFVVDTPYADYLPVFWEGRNNFTATTQILSDLAAQVTTVSPGQNYLVLSIMSANRQEEWPGEPGYEWRTSFNNQLETIYGSHYLDINKILVDSYDPSTDNSAVDASDYNNDEPPTSLRAINGYTTLANSIGPADTSITVQSADAIAIENILTIDTGVNAENVLVTAISGNTLTVQRNFGGLDISHAAAAPVTVTDYDHLNAQGYQIVADAVAQYLSAYEISQQ
jgi:lysophospholipase L1-like esterase